MNSKSAIEKKIYALTAEAQDLGAKDHAARPEAIERCIDLYTSALILCEDLKNDRTLGTIKINLGNSFLARTVGTRKSNLQKAIRYFKEALDILTKDTFQDEWAAAQYNLASAYMQQGFSVVDFSHAADHFQRALEVYTLPRHPERWAGANLELGVAYCRQGKLEEGIKCFTDVLLFAHRSDELLLKGIALTRLGFAECSRQRDASEDDTAQGIAHLEQAAHIFRSCGDRKALAEAQSYLGQVYSALQSGVREDNVKRALECFRDAGSTLYESGRESDLLNADGILKLGGELSFHDEQWGVAKEFYLKCLDILLRRWNMTPSAIGRTSLLEGSSQMFEHLMVCSAKLGQFSEALDFALWQELGHFTDLLYERSLTACGVTEAERGVFRKLLIDARAAEWQDNLRRYREVTDIQSFTISINNQELLICSKADDSEEPEVTEEELVKTHEKLLALEKEMRTKSPSWMFAPNPVSSQNLIDLARKSNSVIVVLRVTDFGIYAFIVSQNTRSINPENLIITNKLSRKDISGYLSMEWFVLYNSFGANTILRLGDRRLSPMFIMEGKMDNAGIVGDGGVTVRRATFDDWLWSMDRALQKIFAAIIEPIYEELQRAATDTRRIIFLANHGLHILPFGAAYSDDDGRRRYLMDAFEIVAFPSASLLEQCLAREDRVSTNTERRFSAIGDPTGDLKMASWEAEFISKHIFSGQGRTLLGAYATKEASRAILGEATDILLSCHAKFDIDYPIKSCLRLANRSKLGLSDIVGANLSKVRLAVLSACETSLGDITDILDEKIGLHTAFLMAGVSAVVATLWKVDDISTMLLITKFYEYLFQTNSKIDVACSLQRAQSWLRNCTAADIEDALSEILKELNKSDEAGAGPDGSTAEAVMRRVHELASDYEGKPFSHPYWWAAFQCYGLGWDVARRWALPLQYKGISEPRLCTIGAPESRRPETKSVLEIEFVRALPRDFDGTKEEAIKLARSSVIKEEEVRRECQKVGLDIETARIKDMKQALEEVKWDVVNKRIAGKLALAIDKERHMFCVSIGVDRFGQRGS